MQLPHTNIRIAKLTDCQPFWVACHLPTDALLGLLRRHIVVLAPALTDSMRALRCGALAGQWTQVAGPLYALAVQTRLRQAAAAARSAPVTADRLWAEVLGNTVSATTSQKQAT